MINPTSLTDKNLYAYCDNNPIMRMDADGEFWNIATGAVIGAAISMATQVVDNALAGTALTDGLLTAAVGGIITGGLAASGANVIVQSLVSGAVSGISDYISQVKEYGKNNVNYWRVGVSTAIGIAGGAYGKDGVRHKNGEVAKAKKVYDYAVDGVKNRKWTGKKGSTYLRLSSKNYRKTLNSAAQFAHKRYRRAAGVGMLVKRSYLIITKI